MSTMEQFKLCPKCKKLYSWNPSVGSMWCPACGPSANKDAAISIINKIFGKK